MLHEPMLAANGNPRPDAGLAELRALLASEQVARRRAEAADASKDAFLMRLGHEWRTPLSAISAAADVLEGVESTNDPLAREARDVIRRQALALAARVDSVVDATRVISGRFALSRSRVDLAAVAWQAVDAIQSSGQADHCELRLTHCEEWVEIDPLRVGQAVTQLLGNALRSTPAGGSVEVEVGDDVRGVFLRVKDDGSGMDPIAAARLFGLESVDPTAGVYESGLEPGVVAGVVAGIGIRFVTTVMSLQGGRCEVDTAPNGTAVSLRFASTASKPAPCASAAWSPSRSMRALKVLLVDDSGAAHSVRQSLVEAGCVVEVTQTAQALGLVVGGRPDLTFVVIREPLHESPHDPMREPPFNPRPTAATAGASDAGHLALARQARAAGHAGRMLALVSFVGSSVSAASAIPAASARGADADASIATDATRSPGSPVSPGSTDSPNRGLSLDARSLRVAGFDGHLALHPDPDALRRVLLDE